MYNIDFNTEYTYIVVVKWNIFSGNSFFELPTILWLLGITYPFGIYKMHKKNVSLYFEHCSNLILNYYIKLHIVINIKVMLLLNIIFRWS